MASNYIWRPTKDIVDEANVQNLIQMFKTKDYKDFIRFSIKNLRSFWGRALEILDIEWFREFDEVLDVSQGIEWSRWYVGGRINASYNVVDRVVNKGFGEKKAFITLKPGYKPSKDLAVDIYRHVIRSLPRFKIPRIIEFVDELPKTISGKIRRVELRELEAKRKKSGARGEHEYYYEELRDLIEKEVETNR